MKTCVRCKQEKTESEYYKTKSKTGLHHYCKSCCKEIWQAYRTKDGTTRPRKPRKKYITPIEKQCTYCKAIKSITEFNRRTERANGFRPKCKLCEAELHAKWAETCTNTSRNRNLLSKYGISEIEYDEILTSQQNGCAICGTRMDQTHKKLPVDHDHNTGKVRGILCSSCNKGIGLLKDDPTLLQKAVNYLTKIKI